MHVWLRMTKFAVEGGNWQLANLLQVHLCVCTCKMKNMTPISSSSPTSTSVGSIYKKKKRKIEKIEKIRKNQKKILSLTCLSFPIREMPLFNQFKYSKTTYEPSQYILGLTCPSQIDCLLTQILFWFIYIIFLSGNN